LSISHALPNSDWRLPFDWSRVTRSCAGPQRRLHSGWRLWRCSSGRAGPWNWN